MYWQAAAPSTFFCSGVPPVSLRSPRSWLGDMEDYDGPRTRSELGAATLSFAQYAGDESSFMASMERMPR